VTPADLIALAGRTLIVGFDGTEAPPELVARVRAGRVGGVIVFGRNIRSPEQLAALCQTLRASAPPGRPLLVSVDQEGGRVQRVRGPATEWPPMAAVGRCGQIRLTYRLGQALGAELRALGFTLDFAPVLDVHTNPANPVIGDRAFGADPQTVIDHGLALMRGLLDVGIAPCAKHYPGHGDTAQDSHLDLPVVTHDEDRLRAVELAPFAAAAAAGVPLIMTAHVLYPALDPDWPATLSPRILGLLRTDYGFGGVVVSDDLEMKAVADRYGIEELAPRSLRAGCDAFLICRSVDLQERALGALVRAGEQDSAVADRLREAAARVDALAARFGAGPYAPPADLRARLGVKQHRELVTELLAARDAVS
jgi:beta-N-acetylhexosaminidase